MCALHFFFSLNHAQSLLALRLSCLHCFSFSGKRSTVVHTQGPSTPLNREFSSISSCSFFFFPCCQLTIHGRALRLSVCCELQAPDEKNLTPQRQVLSRSSQYIRMANACFSMLRRAFANPRRESYTSGSRTPSVAQSLRFQSFSIKPGLKMKSLRGLRRSAFLFQLFL